MSYPTTFDNLSPIYSGGGVFSQAARDAVNRSSINIIEEMRGLAPYYGSSSRLDGSLAKEVADSKLEIRKLREELRNLKEEVRELSADTDMFSDFIVSWIVALRRVSSQ